MNILQRCKLAAPLAAVAALLVAACGGGAEPTATPPPPTAAPTRAAPTPAPVSTATSAAPAATATPRPAATQPPASPTVPALPGKRGGVMQLPALATQPYAYDMYESGGVYQAGHEVWQAMFNNIIWPDPYGNGQVLKGDAAERWDISQDGTVITLFLRKGIKFHDGNPLTSKDVFYNIERAWKPRSSKMTAFKAKMDVIKDLAAPDDYTIRITLKQPSNAFFQNIAMNQFVIYPAHLPFPEKEAEYRKQPIGSGPFKVKTIDPGIKIEYVRNDDYWKTGLPYLDGVTLNPLSPESVIASFRTGRLFATDFNSNELTPTVVKQLQQAQGFIPLLVGQGPAMLILNQREPWTNPKVREAVSLALDRQAVLKTWRDDVGSSYASPLLMPELGGKWGISTEVMKNRPGFRADKKQEDIARAKQLIKDSGVDPSKFTVVIRSSPSWPPYGQTVEASFRELGFKTNLTELPAGESTDAIRRGDFDVNNITSSITFDDPSDYLVSWVVTGGGSNWGKWSDPRIDKLLDDQDKTLDEAKRKQQLIDLQNIILDDTFGAWIPVLQRQAYVGYMPWVKNYPPKLPFNHSPRFRWEEVWIER